MSVSNSPNLDPTLFTLFPGILEQQKLAEDEVKLELKLTNPISNTAAFEKYLQTLAKTSNLSLSIVGLPEILDPLLAGIKKNLTGQVKSFRCLVGQKAPTRLNVMNLAEFLQSCPKLTSLDFSQCGKLTSKNLLSLLQAKSQGVTDLNIATCTQLKSEELDLLPNTPLRTFSLAGCPVLSEEALIRFLETRGQALETLNLSKCTVTNTLCSHLPPTLKQLILGEIQLTYEALCTLLERLPQLQELEVAYPDNFGSLKLLSLEKLQHFITPATSKMPVEHVKFVCNRLLKHPSKPDESLAKKIEKWAENHNLQDIILQCQNLYIVVVVKPPSIPQPQPRPASPPPPPTPKPVPIAIIEEIQYDVIKKKSTKDRSVFCVKTKMNLRSEDIPEGPITLKINSQVLATLDETSPTLHFIKTYLSRKIDKLHFELDSATLPEAGLHLLANACPSITRLRLVDCSELTPQVVTHFSKTLREVHASTPHMAFETLRQVVDECRLLESMVCQFAFAKESFQKASSRTLLQCMLIDFPNLTSEYAEVIVESYLKSIDSLLHPVRKQVIAFALKYRLHAPLKKCLEMLNLESPCALEVEDSFLSVKLLVVGLRAESMKWKEVEETLDLIYFRCKFAGTLTLEVDSESLQANSKPKAWLDQIAYRYGNKIIHLKGEEPASDANVSASPFLEFAAKLTNLQHLELYGVEVAEDDRPKISRLTAQLDSVVVDETAPILLVIPEQNEHVDTEQSTDESVDNYTDILSLLYNQDGCFVKNDLARVVAKREIVPLEFLSRLLETSLVCSDLFEPSATWINAYFSGWIQYDSNSNTATVTFAKGCLPSWLSELTYQSAINVIEFLYTKRSTFFRAVYFDEFDTLPVSLREVICQVTTAITLIGWDSCAWELVVLEHKNLSQVSFGACLITYSEIAKLHAKFIDIHYDEVSGLGVLDKLNSQEIVALFSCLAKDNQTHLLDESVTLTSMHFAMLFASNLPEHELYCISRFNNAFGNYARFETAHSLQLFPQKDLPDDLPIALNNIADLLELNVELHDDALLTVNQAHLSYMLGMVARSVKGVTLRNHEALSAGKGQKLYSIDEAFNAIMACFNMTAIAIENSDTSGRPLTLLATACPKIKEVRLVNCPYVTPQTMHEALAKWDVIYLSLAHNRELTDRALETIISGLSVVDLDLSGNSSLTDAALLPLSKLTELSSLNLNGCQNMTLTDAFTFPKLQKLHLAQCRKIKNQAILKFAEKNCQLLSLNLSANPDVSSLTFASLVKHCPKLKELQLASCYQLGMVEILELAAAGFLYLSSLDIECCKEIDEATLKTLIFFTPTLSYINAYGCKKIPESLATILATGFDRYVEEIPPCKKATDTTLNILTFKYPRLKRFQIEHSPDVSLYELEASLRKWEDLESLTVIGPPLSSDRVVWSILRNAPYLTELSLEECLYLTDEALLLISQYGKKLHHLRLKDSPKFTDKGIQAILQNLPHLERLEIIECPAVTLHEVVKSPTNLAIKHLHIASCRNITNEALITLTQCCTYLTQLEVIGNSKLSSHTLQVIKANNRRLQKVHTDLKIDQPKVTGDAASIEELRSWFQQFSIFT